MSPRTAPAGCVLIATALVLAACGRGSAPAPAAKPYVDPGYAEAGPFRLHYALTPARDLRPDIAGSYGIQPRRNLAVLTAVLLPRDAAAGARVTTPHLEATAIALTGERTLLRLERHDAAGAPTWLAPVEFRHRVPVTIEIRARASPASPEISVRLTREFRVE